MKKTRTIQPRKYEIEHIYPNQTDEERQKAKDEVFKVIMRIAIQNSKKRLGIDY